MVVQETHEYGDSVEVAYMLRSMVTFNDLSVTVASDSSWTWVLACCQVGVKKLKCVCLSSEARENLACLNRAGLSLLGNLEELVLPITPAAWGKIVLVEIQNPHHVAQLPVDGPERVVIVGSTEARDRYGRTTNQKIIRQRFTHRKLGGLTVATVDFWWHGENEKDLKLKGVGYPQRPLNKFINVAAKLPLGEEARVLKTKDFWWSSEGNTPFGWPFPKWPIIIECPSVFVKGKVVKRKLNYKEACQLLDVPGIWPADLVEQIWSWNKGFVLPLRLQVEFLLRSATWMNSSGQRLVEETEQFPTTPTSDLSRLLVQTKGSTQIGETGLFRLSYFAWVWEPKTKDEVSTATKADDAEINRAIWAVGGEGTGLERKRETIRRFLHNQWYARLKIEAEAFLVVSKLESSDTEYRADSEAVAECLLRSKRSSWWEWLDGSRLYFWRWPKCWRLEARDGARAFHTSWPIRRPHARQVPVQDDWMKRKHDEKIEKIIARRYIAPLQAGQRVHVGIPNFPVKKGDDDTRAVWSDTENGVNPSIFVPRMYLPSAETMYRKLPPGGWMADYDVGEMFHNFMMHPAERPLAGVDIPNDLQRKLKCPEQMWWERLLFGWRPSPLFASRMLLRGIEIAKRAPDDLTSAFQWDYIRLNFPGSEKYDPGLEYVAKMRKDNLQACDDVTFVDDGREMGPTEELTKAAIRQVTSGIQHLGCQEASRKRRKVGQRNGAWAGNVVYSDQGLDRKFLSQAKWDRGKEALCWIKSYVKDGRPLPFQKFNSLRGYLVHFMLTYTAIKPYMKGVHLTANVWRGNRDADGWAKEPVQRHKEEEEEEDLENQMMEKEMQERHGEIVDSADSTVESKSQDEKDVQFVTAVPRLLHDLEAMEKLTSSPSPLMVVLRPVRGIYYLAYGFVDASEEGFGGSLRKKGKLARDLLKAARLGFWCSAVSERSSNYREFRNLVEHIRKEARMGLLAGLEVWIYTDNQVTESIWYNGTSGERTLFDLVLDLKMVMLEGNFILHVVHVAGTRMIAEGTDGLSRGEIMASALMDDFAHRVPQGKFALDRSPNLGLWLKDWIDPSYKIATPKDWFWGAQHLLDFSFPPQKITWVWDIPPAAAPHILEELAMARSK
jgi:hypothetical protein